jgi:UDP-glucuronate 4-epimerase
MAIHAFARRIEDGLPVTVFGDGSSGRDYTWCGDVADGVLRALDRARGFRVYNLGGSRTTTLARLVALLEGALGKTAAIERRPDQPGDVPVTCADPSRAREELGWEARVPIEEGIPRFVAWMRARS